VVAVPPLNMQSYWAPNFAVIAFAVVLSAIVFAWGYSAFVQVGDEELEPTEIVATVTPFASDVALPTPTPVTPTPEPTATPAPTDPPAERVDSGRIDAPQEIGGGDNQVNRQGTSEGQSQPIERAANAEPVAGTYVTSISITALEQPISLSIVADGVAVFEGRLDPGETSGFFDGSVFEVYTSSGASTEFTNSCGIPFNMGWEPGEAFYILNADEDSCDPING
jgi:hypothetical protein